jgi:pyridoxal phosphate enzyme (YggS family)
VTTDLVARLEEVRARIDAVSDGRPVSIIGVTKGFGVDAVAAAVEAGLTDLGENYAQELEAKAPAGRGVTWHFIGAVQRNKVAKIAPLVGLWHTVDRPELADAIAHRAPGAAALVQVNLTGASNRGGCAWGDLAAVVGASRRAGLDVRGLMGVGRDGPPEDSREMFAALASEGRRLGLPELSMGMSADLEIAVQEGSTMVRVGTSLFGQRPSR